MSRLTPLLYVISLCIVNGLSQETANEIDFSQFDDDCFDSIGPVYKGLTCGQLVNESTGYCYTAIEDYCCVSCATADTGINDCEYGDRSMDCDVDSCSKYDDDTREDMCCKTCATFLESDESGKGNNEEEKATTTPVATPPSPQPTPPTPSPPPPPTTAAPPTTPKPIIKAPKPSTKPVITKPKAPLGIPVYIPQSRPTIEIKQQQNAFKYKKPKLPEPPPKDIDSVVIVNEPLIPITKYQPPVEIPVQKSADKVEKTLEKPIENVYKLNRKVETIAKPKVEVFESGPAADWVEPGDVISNTQKYLTLSAPQMSSPNQLQKTVLSMPILEERNIAVHNSVPVNNFQEGPFPQTETLVERFQGDGSLGVGVISSVEKTIIKTSLNNNFIAPVKHINEKGIINTHLQNIFPAKGKQEMIIQEPVAKIEAPVIEHALPASIETAIVNNDFIAPVKRINEKGIINTHLQNIVPAKGKQEMIIQEPVAKIEAPVIDHALPASIETAIVGKPAHKHKSFETPVVQHNDLLSLHPGNIQDLATIVVGKNGEITIEKPKALEKEVKHKKETKSEIQNAIKSPKESASSSKSALKSKESVELKLEKPVVTEEISLDEEENNSDDDDSPDTTSPPIPSEVPTTASVAQEADPVKPAEPKVHYIIEEQEQPLTLQKIYPVESNDLDKNLFIRRTHNFKVITRKRTKSTDYAKSSNLLASGQTKPKIPKPIILNDIHLNSSPVKKPKPIILREAHFNAPTILSLNSAPRSFHSTGSFGYRPKLFIIKSVRHRRPSVRRQIRLLHRQRPRLFEEDSNGLVHDFHTVGEFPNYFTLNTFPLSFLYPTQPHEYPIFSHSFPTFSHSFPTFSHSFPTFSSF